MVIGHLHITNATGIKGEEIAVKSLTDKGFTILERNWKLGPKEVDIIAADKTTVVFAEVKCRTSMFAGSPEECVTPEKKRNMLFAANAYMKIHHEERVARFDIIGVLLDPATGDLLELTHLESAFTAPIRSIGMYSYSGQNKWHKKSYRRQHGF